MNKEASAVISRGELIGIGVCPKCNIINKFRTTDIFNNDRGKCHSCGSEVDIQKRMGK